MCHHPWVGLEIGPQGEFKPCCKYKDSIATNLKDYLASEELSKLKSSLSANEKPNGCQRCWDDESAGLPSKRQLDNQYVFGGVEPNHSSLKILSFAFGNSCNLACRTCDSYSSSTWIVESKKLEKHIPDIKIHQHKRFYQDLQFIKELKDISGDVMHVEFPGGEPFLAGISEHLDFLDFLISKNPQEVSLHYMTNATIFPSDEFWSRWSKFKKVDVQLSIDGTVDQFEYLRWPAKWPAVEDNILRYISLRDQINNLQLSISHTVSIFNVYYLPEFIKWCLQNRLGKPYLGLVADPSVYNIRSLPMSVKDKVTEKISRFKLENVVSYMYEQDLTADANWVITELLDQQREQSFSNTFPEFYQILKEQGCLI